MKIKLTVFLFIMNSLFSLSLSANEISYEKITNYSHGGKYTDFDRIVLEDDILYIVSKFALDIYSVDNSENILLSSTPFKGEIKSIQKYENIIMLQVYRKNPNSMIENRFYQIDISDCYNPQILASFTDTANSYSKETSLFNDKFVYHNRDANNEGVVGLTFIDPFTFELTTIDINGYAYYLKENYFMMLNADNHSISNVFDFTDLNNITHVSTIPTPQGYGGTCSLKPVTDDLLVWLGFDAIILYDISDIHNAHELGSYISDLDPTFRFACQLIGDKLITGAASWGLELLDISDLNNPEFLEYYPVYNWSSFVKNENKIYFAGDLEISIIELDGNSLTQIDSISNDIQYSGLNTIVNGYHFLSGFWHGLYYYNIDNPDTPNYEGSLFQEDYITTLNVKESKLYVTHYDYDLNEEQLTVINIPANASPEIIYETNLANSTVYSTFSENGKYYCISVNPPILQKFTTDDEISLEYSTPITMGSSYVINDDYLYIAEFQNPTQLSIYSGLSENTLIEENTFNAFLGNTYKISKVGDYLCQSSQIESGIGFYSLEDPISPALEFEINLNSRGKANIKDDILFVDAFYTMYMYDLTTLDYTNPEPISYINLESMYKSIQFNDNNFYVIQRETLTSFEYNITTDASDTEIHDLPPTLTNYPNPFKPAAGRSRTASTTINYALPQAGLAEIIIYNLKGQKIKTLLSEQQPAGKHTITWDGRNENGKVVASGVYLYQLQVDGQSVARQKMMLVK